MFNEPVISPSVELTKLKFRMGKRYIQRVKPKRNDTKAHTFKPVSYTHLTLPTILLV